MSVARLQELRHEITGEPPAAERGVTITDVYVEADGERLGAMAARLGAGEVGRREEALSLIQPMESDYRKFMPATSFAVVYARFDPDRAVAWLNKGADDHDFALLQIGVSQAFDPIRQTPGFQAVLKRVADEKVEYVLFWFTDLEGHLKSFAITLSELEGALDDGMGFDGSSITGFNAIEESDMVAIPDPATFQILPAAEGEPRIGRMICDVVKPDG